MIIDDLKNANLYIKAFPYIKEAFNYLNAKNGNFSIGKEEITPQIFASVEESFSKPKEEQKLEAHAKHIDLHYIIKGQDEIGWKSLSDCKDISIEYNENKDIIFYNEKADFNAIINEGKFALIFPEDAHAPLSGKQKVMKCIIKIKTEIQK